MKKKIFVGMFFCGFALMEISTIFDGVEDAYFLGDKYGRGRCIL